MFLDIGYKSEGILPLADFQNAGETVKRGDKMLVSIKGRDPEGYYELSRGSDRRPKDWPALEKAFAEKAAIAGTVTGVVKGGLSVDVGVRASCPPRAAARATRPRWRSWSARRFAAASSSSTWPTKTWWWTAVRWSKKKSAPPKTAATPRVKEGETVRGTVRSLTDYGAFVDIGGVDALLHVADISWGASTSRPTCSPWASRLRRRYSRSIPAQEAISLGMKQLQPHPWELAGREVSRSGERVQGTVTRVADFGAFVELEKGIEGLMHLSEMSWSRKVRKPSDVVKPGETVEVVVLGVNAGRPPHLARTQAGAGRSVGGCGAAVPRGRGGRGPVISLQKFGAFVQLAEGVEGMIHVGDISAEKRINHPQDVLKMDQVVRRRCWRSTARSAACRLGMKQLVPTSLDEYIAEHKEGDMVTGRMIELSGSRARVELGKASRRRAGSRPRPRQRNLAAPPRRTCRH